MMLSAFLLLAGCASGKVVTMKFENAVSDEPTNGWSYTSEVQHSDPPNCGFPHETCMLLLALQVIDVAYKSPMEDPTCPIEKAFIDRYIEVHRSVGNETVISHRFQPSFMDQNDEEKEVWDFDTFGKCGNGSDEGFPSGTLRKKFPESCTDLTLEVEHNFEQYHCEKPWLATNIKNARKELGRSTTLLYKSRTVKLEYAVEGWPEAPCGKELASKVKGKSVRKAKMEKGADSCDCQAMCEAEEGVTNWMFTAKGRKIICECLTDVKGGGNKKAFTGVFAKE